MESKICSQCKLEKDVSEFGRDYRNKKTIRYLAACKKCRRKYVDKNIEKKRQYERDTRCKYKEKRKTYIKKYCKTQKHKDYIDEYRHRDYVKQLTHRKTTTPEYRAKRREYRRRNYDEIIVKEREYRKRNAKKPEIRIMRSLRARLQTILKRSNGSKSNKMIELVGCTMPFLRQYLESLWKPNMRWDNYGKNMDNWVMDHIIPCAKFDLTDPKQQKECFHYTNLQPLWFLENASKLDK